MNKHLVSGHADLTDIEGAKEGNVIGATNTCMHRVIDRRTHWRKQQLSCNINCNREMRLIQINLNHRGLFECSLTSQRYYNNYNYTGSYERLPRQLDRDTYNRLVSPLNRIGFLIKTSRELKHFATNQMKMTRAMLWACDDQAI